jgi:hypothetical protein
MKQSPDSFQLIAREEQSRDQWLAAKAGADIGSCIPLHKIPTEELEALQNMLSVELWDRDKDYVKFVERMPF